MERCPTFRLRDMISSLFDLHVLWRRQPTQRVFFKQIYFTGLQALPLVLLVGGAVAGIIIAELRQFGQSPKDSIDILLDITLSELAPLLTAFLVTARSAPAMASELATMQANGEIRLLMRLGVPPIDYLIVPRVAGMAVAGLLLAIYFSFAATLAGGAFAAKSHMFDALTLAAESAGITLFVQCLMKSLLFGAAIGSVSCFTGLAARGSFTEVPIAASRAVVRSLVAVLVLDLLLVML